MAGTMQTEVEGFETAEDPVCHMRVDAKNPPGGTHGYGGKTYYFCGAGCREGFAMEPYAYISRETGMDM